jgi:hypothetical protein
MRFGKRAATLVVIVVLVASVFGGWYYFTSTKKSAIYIQVTPQGGYFQNLTVSCYGCVAVTGNKNLWQGVMTVATAVVDINGTGPNSSAIGLSQAKEVPITANSPCLSGYEIKNSTCVYSVGPLPVTISFNIAKVSTGGVLKTTLYLFNKNPLIWQTTTGNLSKTMTFQSD